MFNLSEFFEDAMIKRALKGISHMHHFLFTSKAIGKVFVKGAVDNNE